MATGELDLELAQLQQLAKGATADFSNLAKITREFASVSPKGLTLTLKQAREILDRVNGDAEQLKKTLKETGIVNRGLLVTQLNKGLKEAVTTTKELGSEVRKNGGLFKDFWSTEPIRKWIKEAKAGLSDLRAVNIGANIAKSVGRSAMDLGSRSLQFAVDEGKHLIHKVLELGGEAEASQKGLSYILSGGAEKGSPEYEKGEATSKHMMGVFLALAKKTPIADRDIVAAGKDFATALSGSGRSMEQVEKISLQLVKVMADQQSKFLEDSSVRRNFVNTVTRGLGKTTASLQDLNSLRVAKFNIGAILEQLPAQKGIAELMGKVKGGKFKVTPEDLAQARENVGEGEISSKELENMAKMQKLLSMAKQAGTPISFATLFNAAQASIYKNKDVGEAAGGLANLKATTTLIGAMNNAENAFDNLILGMDFANTKGAVALRDFLNRFNTVVGESGVLKQAVANFTDALFKPLERMTDQNIEHLIGMAAKAGTAVGDAIKQIWEWIKRLLDAEPGTLIKNAKDVLIQAGGFLGQGILKGMSVGAAELAGVGRYSSTAQGSSSRAWRNLWEDTGGKVSGALYSLVAPKGEAEDGAPATPTPSFRDGGVVGGSGPMGSPQIIEAHKGERFLGVGRSAGTNITVPIQLFYSGSADADDLTAALEPVATRVFRNIYERMAMEIG